MSEPTQKSRPVIYVAVSPRSERDLEYLQRVLLDIARQDSTLEIKPEPMSRQPIIRGMSELYLEAVCDRLVHEFNIQLDVGEPKVIYLEAIRKPAEAEGKYIRQTGGSGNYGHVQIRLEANEEGRGFEFIDDIKSGEFPREYIAPIEQGFTRRCRVACCSDTRSQM